MKQEGSIATSFISQRLLSRMSQPTHDPSVSAADAAIVLATTPYLPSPPAPNARAPSFAPESEIARKKQKHFPMSKGLIWLMFHPLQVRQGPMEN
jgi:hypothetical protein